jgi:hypothetical protein
MRQIYIILPDGSVKIQDVVGAGTNCMEATQQVEKLLGTVDTASRKLTDQYYLPPEKLHEQVKV